MIVFINTSTKYWITLITQITEHLNRDILLMIHTVQKLTQLLQLL